MKKWFITDKAKSKGYYTDWQKGRISFEYPHWYRDIKGTADPSFTKQSALATSYATEKDAQLEVAKIKKQVVSDLNKTKQYIKKYEKYKSILTGTNQTEKLKVCAELDIVVPCMGTNWGGRRYQTSFSATRYVSSYSDLDVDQRKGLEELDYDMAVLPYTNMKSLFENRLTYIEERMVIRECELEFKFKDNERYRLSWYERDEDETCNNYCNCCGGAIPSIPQLNMTGRFGRVSICAICMGKLAQEAKIQVGKVPDEIMEQYEQDRFLRSLS